MSHMCSQVDVTVTIPSVVLRWHVVVWKHLLAHRLGMPVCAIRPPFDDMDTPVCIPAVSQSFHVGFGHVCMSSMSKCHHIAT